MVGLVINGLIIALAYIPVQFRWIAKKELFSIPLFGAAMRNAGYVEIDRDNRKEALQNLDKADLERKINYDLPGRHKKPQGRDQIF